MATFDAVFVGLTILDIAGRPVVAIPPRGGVAFIEQIRLNPAGTAAGANINAAKLGIRTAAVACTGEDEKADFILASYARLGIDCSLIQRTALKETSATILPIRPNGERPALHCRGASDALFVSEAEFDAVLDCRFLHHGGTGLLAAMDQDRARGCCRRPKRAESPPALTLSPRMKRPSNYCGPCCRRWIISCLRWRKPPFSPERRSRRPSATSSWRSAWAPAF